ncbi:peptidoglycan endopeptidase [Pseudobacillus wudalianchiensis]|uniref:Peptidoglycan endopeptidase n=1 Tax=Pseudobacillus wudalianchiensis TaxID=1743143 RepID=A0A1B9AYZ6_9BACI|nr:peptidoglycan endopeptidase [Bacillus wudalianchiensis]OCA88973.1 hypothetical protein A8F95_06040 [Bacillus wudalianchiensis]
MRKKLFTLSTAAFFSTGAATMVHAAEQHVVKPGETLSSIAKQYEMDVNTLKALNHLEKDQLQENQVLQVSRNTVATSERTHTVQAGETVYSIAKLYQMKETELASLNHLGDQTIYVGQELKVYAKPAAGQSAAVQRPLPEAESHTRAAKPAVEAPARQTSATGIYIVHSGDTLGAIAKAYQMDDAQLRELNGLKDNVIYAGQELKISSPAAPGREPSAVSVKMASVSTYTIKSGDSLSAIAKAHSMTVAELQKLNGLTSHFIYAGQKLKVNGKPAAVAPQPPKPSPTVTRPSSSGAYTVKSGDSLSAIAKKYQMSLAELKQLNHLIADTIFVGQSLKVSGQAKQPAPAPAAPKPSSPVTKPAASGVYTVQSGDSLSRIAQKYQMSLTELKQLNNLTSDAIFVGQKLKISGQPAPPAPAPTTPKPSSPVTNPSATGTYTVKSGDSLSLIAKRYNMSLAELKRLNNLTSDSIFVGQKLKVTGGETSAGQSPSSQPEFSNAPFSVAALIAESKKHLGIPYVWGGAQPSGFDCSGFIYYVFNKAGKNIPRTNTDGYYSRSYYVDKPQAGDLVFFVNTYKQGISHMGIYIGGNQFIQASSSQGITITSLDNAYFKQRFDSFKRFY